LISGLHSLVAVLVLALHHDVLMLFAVGNGYSCVFLAKYCLSISAVCSLSLYVPLSCCFVPIMLILPSWAFICWRGVISSSCSSVAVSVIIWKIVLMFFELFDIMASTSFAFGISGIGDFCLYDFGFVNCIPLISQNTA